jgi:outer membrane lipoprotein-sorting protein
MRHLAFIASVFLPFVFCVATSMQATSFAAELTAPDAVRELRVLVPQVTVTLDEKLGVAQHIASPSGFLTGPAGMGRAVAKAAAAGPDQTVRNFLNTWPMLLGGDATILDDAEIVRDDTTAHSGLHTKIWRQQLNGIPVHGGLLITHTTQREELIAIGSHFVKAPDRSLQGIAKRAAIIAQPTVSAEAAVTAILHHFEVPATDAAMAQNIGGAIQKQILRSAGAKGDIHAQLTWFPLTKDNLRLAWEIIIVERAHGIMYAMVVDAQSAEILSSSRLTSKGLSNPHRNARAAPAQAAPAQAAPAQAAPAAIARAVTTAVTATPSNANSATSNLATTIALRVYTGDSPTPLSPGYNTPNSTQPAEVARTLVTLASLDATASPDGWIDGNKETRGNNVDAHLDLNDDNLADTPRPKGTGTSPVTFDFPIDLRNAPSTYQDAAVTNLFYWCNFAHDRLYQLGFTETAGNFQRNNFSRGGVGNDEVQADAQDGGGTDNANFETPPDGINGRMQMYVFTDPTPDRDGDLDATVVLHEYGHGLSGRLVGGGISSNLDAVQSGGMGEGWSDFYAIALLSDPADNPLGTYAAGSYLTMNYFSAIRRYPYAVETGPLVTSTSLNPLTFSDVIANREVHAMGEVWCQTLWECRGELITKYGAAAGNTLMLQLVTDGMKLTPAKPSYTQARDAILQADLVANSGANAAELWRGFGKRGLGFGAVSGASSTTSDAVDSFEFTLGLQVSNAAGFSAQASPGGSFTPTSTTFILTNASTSPISWTTATGRSWFTVSPASGTLAGRTNTTVASITITVTVSAAGNALTSSHNGLRIDYLVVNDTTNGRSLTRPLYLTVAPNYTVASTPYSWIDPNGHSPLGLGDDTVSTSQVLPFAFPFYGSNRTTVVVSSNGLVGFGNTTSLEGAFNRSLPSTSFPPHDMLAVLWDDLNPRAAGSVSIGSSGTAPNRKAIISWVEVPHYYPTSDTTNTYNFQAILEESTGDLVCQYKEIRPAEASFGAGQSATIGVENAVGDVARQYSFNGTTRLTNSLALRFHYVAGTAPPTNAAPTVAVAVAASPAPVTGTTATLSVLGADDGGEANLMYTWSINGTPSSIFTVTANGSHAASTTTATFTQPGTYPITATITDAEGKSVTSTTNVVVSTTLTTLTISPATTSLANGTSVDFSVAGKDQFNHTIPGEPTVTWSVLSGGGSINGSGLYTATTQGTSVIQAQAGAITATATITVTNGIPTVATVAAATPSPVNGTTTNLSALGADDVDTSVLIYTWSAVGTTPAPVTFNPNGTNAAKNSVATFTKAGVYTLRVTITDTQGGSVTSDVTLTVNQVANGNLAIDPRTVTMDVNTTRAFVTRSSDQFGDPITSSAARSVVWTTTFGTIFPSGLFAAPDAIGTATITATEVGGGGLTASATVTVVPPSGNGRFGGSPTSGGGKCGFGAASAALFMLLLMALHFHRRRMNE